MSIISMIPYILLAILAFGVLVFVHELGHFTLAKANGVFVEEFAIGMGPKLIGFTKGETLYSIRALPIGGYVKMLGENEDSDNPRSFNKKSPLQRISIIIAGPLMNFITAIILFAIITLSVGAIPTLTVDSLIDNSPAKQAGMLSGDKIVKINGDKINIREELSEKLYKSNGKPLDVQVLRNGESFNYNITPAKDEEKGGYVLGVNMVIIENPSLFQALDRSIDQLNYMLKQIVGFFGTLFQGKTDMNDVGGPVSIIKVSVAQAQMGFLNLMYFTAVMSVQLGFFNIIPFPALDGGYLLLYIIELITRRKPNQKVVQSIVTIGFLLLMGLMVLVTLKDIINPIKF
ncbi:MAG: RIP metalloprotease RseP [Clostridiaceae bacterium]